MNAYVDPDLCIGCTQCAGLCPAVFQMEGTLASPLRQDNYHNYSLRYQLFLP